MSTAGAATIGAATEIPYGVITDLTETVDLPETPDRDDPWPGHMRRGCWWTFVATATETMGIDLIGSDFEGNDPFDVGAAFAIYVGDDPGSAVLDNWWDYNQRGGDGTVIGFLPETDYEVTAGQRYYVQAFLEDWTVGEIGYVLRLGKRVIEYGPWQHSDPQAVLVAPTTADLVSSGLEFTASFSEVDSSSPGSKSATIGHINGVLPTLLDNSTQIKDNPAFFGGAYPIKSRTDEVGGGTYDTVTSGSSYADPRIPKMAKFNASSIDSGYAEYGPDAISYQSRFGQDFNGNLGTSTPVDADDDVYDYGVVVGAELSYKGYAANVWGIQDSVLDPSPTLDGETSFGFLDGADPTDRSTWDITTATPVVTFNVSSTGPWTDPGGTVDVSSHITDTRGRYVLAQYLNSAFTITGWDPAYDFPNANSWEYNPSVLMYGPHGPDPAVAGQVFVNTPDVIYAVQLPDWREVRPGVVVSQDLPDPPRRLYPSRTDDLGVGIGRVFPARDTRQDGRRVGSNAVL